MALIRPCADLRNKYNEISQICHETMEPVYITKNGYNDLVLLSNEAYESLSSKYITEKEVEKIISEKLDNHFATFEEFQKDVFENMAIAIKEIEAGKGIPMEEVIAEMEAKYNIDKKI